MHGWQVGIDIGGTFTDVVAYRPGDGSTRMAKVESRPDDPISSLLAGLQSLGISWDAVDDLVHGTTMVTNAIIENRLARVALITTRGFADTIADENPDSFSPQELLAWSAMHGLASLLVDGPVAKGETKDRKMTRAAEMLEAMGPAFRPLR